MDSNYAAPRRRGGPLVTLLLALATLTTVGALGAHWLDRQALSTSGWTATSSRAIANPTIRRAVSTIAVDRAFTDAGIDTALARVLPAAAAHQAQTRLRADADRDANALLASPRGRRLWQTANRQAQRRLLAATAGSNRAVAIDLSALVNALLHDLAGTAVARAIPGSAAVLTSHPGSGRLVVIGARQARALHGAVTTIRTLNWALGLITLGLLALALVTAGGARLRTLSAIGYRLVIAGGGLLVARWVARWVVSSVSGARSADKGAVRAAWMIATTQLRDGAEIVLVAGLAVIVVSLGLRAVVAGGRTATGR